MRGRRDDDVRLRWLFVGKRCRRGVRRSPRSCKMILLISPCPIWRWGWQMVMLDNKLYLVSVVWFLHRSRVDCGMGGRQVVVGSDSSKQKVHTHHTSYHNLLLYSQRDKVKRGGRDNSLLYSSSSSAKLRPSENWWRAESGCATIPFVSSSSSSSISPVYIALEVVKQIFEHDKLLSQIPDGRQGFTVC